MFHTAISNLEMSPDDIGERKSKWQNFFSLYHPLEKDLEGVAWTRSQERASFPGDRCLFVLTVTHAANANRGFFLPLCLYFITLLFDSNIFCYFVKRNHWSIHYVSYVVLLHSSAEKGGGFAAVKTNSLRFLRTFLLRTARQIFRFPIHLSVRLRQGDAMAKSAKKKHAKYSTPSPRGVTRWLQSGASAQSWHFVEQFWHVPPDIRLMLQLLCSPMCYRNFREKT